MRWWFILLVSTFALACDLEPSQYAKEKSPGDNYYKVVINGNVERYAPDQRYVVTLVGSQTHDVVQQFTKFKLSLEPLDPSSERSPRKQGQFQLFADTLTAFDEECSNSVVQADDLPKTEVLVMWKAPPAGSGCVLIKAMVYENESSWFAEDGQLTKRVCEDTSLSKLDCCACDDAKYKMTFEGLWSSATHPKDFPVEALWLTHFSDVIGASHPRGFSFWGEGEIATDGFRSLAEWGSVGLLERELRQRGPLLRSIVKAQGLWFPKVNSNTSATFSVDRRRHLLSLASMFGPSPDWVVGVNGLNLCQMDCSWVQSKVIDLYPYDAGTDSGVSYMSPNVETIPRERMFRITPMFPEDPRAPFYSIDEKPILPLARLYINREEVISRQCDEKTLNIIATEEAENTENTNKPECSVTEWSEWSPCSVSCGKGLRTRNRSYINEIKAKKNNCDRQIVGREMCVADVAECPPQPPASENTVNTGVEEPPLDPEMCATSSWSLWSECSVTCGIGFQTKRRSFINHMGYKKCPLVSIEENRKCMEPQCAESEPESVDPGCPTTAWSGWSPCSASCGRGVATRTRLLLVSAEQQTDCSARVELLQQRTCRDRESCDIDMPTAKQICMQAPEQGPCRGMYTRWAFVSLRGRCEQFHYGGCRGNRNNFISKEDCDNACGILLGGGQTNSTTDSSSNQAPDVSTPSSPVSCQLSPWSEWSDCSVECGAGFQEKTRTILVQPTEGGMPCPTRLNRKRRCYRRRCNTNT